MGKWFSEYPRKGWVLHDVSDNGPDPDDFSNCDFCDEAIRYVHTIKHPDLLSAEVGCICCGKLTEDYETARREEAKLRKKVKRYSRWANSPKWRVTDNSNIFRKDDQVLIFKSIRPDFWKVKIHGIWGKKEYASVKEAKKAAYDYLHKPQ